MTKLTYDEQWYDDLDWFAVDRDGRLGHFATAGFRLLPQRVADNKENWELLCGYFNKLPTLGEYVLSPELDKHLRKAAVVRDEQYLSSFAEMSARGLYSFDTYDHSQKNRPYFRVTLPKVDLVLNDLPLDVASILGQLRFTDLSFRQNDVITNETAMKI